MQVQSGLHRGDCDKCARMQHAEFLSRVAHPFSQDERKTFLERHVTARTKNRRSHRTFADEVGYKTCNTSTCVYRRRPGARRSPASSPRPSCVPAFYVGRFSVPKLPSLQVSRTSRTSSHLLSVFSHFKLPFNSYSTHSSPTPPRHTASPSVVSLLRTRASARSR